jgi:hypothetical protein
VIKTKPLPLAVKLQNLLKVCAEARKIQREQAEIIKAALDEGRDNDGFEPAVVRKLIAYRERADKDPAETARVEELTDQYKFLADGGVIFDMPAKLDSEIDRVMALCAGSKPPKIEAIKKALGCSQGKAHKLRSTAIARLAAKSSRSSDSREHEHADAEVPAASPAPSGDEAIRNEGPALLAATEPGTNSKAAPEAVQPPPPTPLSEPHAGEGPDSNRDNLDIPDFLRRVAA